MENHPEKLTALQVIERLVRGAVEWLQSEQAKSIYENILRFTEALERNRRLEFSDWLPHYSITEKVMSDLINKSQDDNELNFQIGKYCRDNWGVISIKFRENLRSINVDEEAKEAFSEALEAHGHGLYKCVPRLLFAEMERVISKIPREQGASNKPHEVINNALEIYGYTELARDQTFRLKTINKLSHHIYHSMWSDKPYPQVYTDPVPNRHAAMHGWVNYNKPYHSFNMLVICEITFSIAGLTLQSRSAAEPEKPK